MKVSETDVGNFDSSFTNQKVGITPIEGSAIQDVDQLQFEGFSYENTNLIPQKTHIDDDVKFLFCLFIY